MKKIKLFPAPHLEVRIHVSEQMEADMRHCKEVDDFDDDFECAQCSWNDVRWDNTGMCELPVVIERVLEEQNEGNNSNG